jgi:hypothetical protein
MKQRMDHHKKHERHEQNESQRDSVLQPKVASKRMLLWDKTSKIESTLSGLWTERSEVRYTGETPVGFVPVVAAVSQGSNCVSNFGL